MRRKDDENVKAWTQLHAGVNDDVKIQCCSEWLECNWSLQYEYVLYSVRAQAACEVIGTGDATKSNPKGNRTLTWIVHRRNTITERRRWVFNTPASHSGDSWFKSRPGYRLQWMKFFRVRFQVLTARTMKFRVFWDVLPCSQIYVDRRFRGDDGGSTHLWNVGQHIFDYTAVHPTRL